MICRESASLQNGNETRLEDTSAMDRSRRSHNIVRKRTNLNESRMISPCSGICEGESGLLVRERGIERTRGWRLEARGKLQEHNLSLFKFSC